MYMHVHVYTWCYIDIMPIKARLLQLRNKIIYFCNNQVTIYKVGE